MLFLSLKTLVCSLLFLPTAQSFIRPFCKSNNVMNVNNMDDVKNTILFQNISPLPKEKEFLPVNSYLKKIKNSVVQIMEPYKVDKSTPVFILFTGLNGLISSEFYSSFMYNLASNNVSICVANFDFKEKTDVNKLIEYLNEQYKDVILMGHSSGSTVLLKTVSKLKNVKTVILFDPVDSRFANSFKKFNVRNLDKIIFINARKSYETDSIPFIPEPFRITENKLNVNKDCVITVIESDESGHCDILNPFYSNMIFETNLVDGLENRTEITNYHKWICERIMENI